jgi:hypothetical protein
MTGSSLLRVSGVSSVSHQLLAFAATIATLVAGAGAAATQGLLPDLQVCQLAPAARVPIGEQLARGEDLRRAAQKFEAFDYDRCYRLGRSCYNEVESPMLTGVEDESYRACRHFSGLERTTFDAWLPLKKRHISCIIENLRQRADAIKEVALGQPTARPTSQVDAVMAELAGQERTLDAMALGRLASGATWCSLQTFRVRALCADGSGAVADGRGQQVLRWKVIENRICLVTFGETPSCFGARISGGRLALMTDKSEADLITVVAGVVEAWSQSCPPK